MLKKRKKMKKKNEDGFESQGILKEKKRIYEKRIIFCLFGWS